MISDSVSYDKKRPAAKNCGLLLFSIIIKKIPEAFATGKIVISFYERR